MDSLLDRYVPMLGKQFAEIILAIKREGDEALLFETLVQCQRHARFSTQQLFRKLELFATRAPAPQLTSWFLQESFARNLS